MDNLLSLVFQAVLIGGICGFMGMVGLAFIILAWPAMREMLDDDGDLEY